MTNTLEKTIEKALSTQNTQDINRVYLEFIKANFLVPVEKDSTDESPKVLFFQENTDVFLPAFTQKIFLSDWAADIASEINILTLSGVNLLQGLGSHVSVSLNLGTRFYKPFLPAELMRMKNMLIKIGLVKTEA